MALICFCFCFCFFVLLQLLALHWLHYAHNKWWSNLQCQCILNAAEFFRCFCVHFPFFIFCPQQLMLRFLSEQTNELFNYLLTNESVNLFGYSLWIFYLVLFVSALVFDQLYSKSYLAYSSSSWNVTSCFFIAPRNLIATWWWDFWQC